MALTVQQKDFIRYVRDGEGNVVLIAKAGTGKTHALVRACDAIAPDQRVLALAFNKSIADELQTRVPGHVIAMTMNSLGHRAWAKHIGTRLTLDKDKTGSILRKLCKDNPGLWSYWSDIATLISKARLHGLVPNGSQGKYKAILADTDENWLSLMDEYDLPKLRDMDFDLFRGIIKESIDKAFAGSIDFDDQIFLVTCWDVKTEHFDVILVDELQDMNPMQHRFIEKMMDDTTRLIVTGDPNQSIYGFRGATQDSMAKATEQYDCKEFPLTVSFRCPKSVIKIAQQDVPDIQHHEDAKEGSVLRPGTWDAASI